MKDKRWVVLKEDIYGARQYIQNGADLRGDVFMACSANSFGGWEWVAYKSGENDEDLIAQGAAPTKKLAKLLVQQVVKIYDESVKKPITRWVKPPRACFANYELNGVVRGDVTYEAGRWVWHTYDPDGRINRGCVSGWAATKQQAKRYVELNVSADDAITGQK